MWGQAVENLDMRPRGFLPQLACRGRGECLIRLRLLAWSALQRVDAGIRVDCDAEMRHLARGFARIVVRSAAVFSATVSFASHDTTTRRSLMPIKMFFIRIRSPVLCDIVELVHQFVKKFSVKIIFSCMLNRSWPRISDASHLPKGSMAKDSHRQDRHQLLADDIFVCTQRSTSVPQCLLVSVLRSL